VTYDEAAQQLGAAIGQPIQYVNIPDPAAHEAMIQAGLSAWVADQLVILRTQLRRGVADTTTDVVRVLSGREPRSVQDFGRDFAGAFSIVSRSAAVAWTVRRPSGPPLDLLTRSLDPPFDPSPTEP
jgi:hypothetical protein